MAQYRFTRMKRTTQLNLESYCFPARPAHPVSVSTSFYQTIGMCLEVIYLKYGATTGGQYKINLAEIHLRLYIANANGTFRSLWTPVIHTLSYSTRQLWSKEAMFKRYQSAVASSFQGVISLGKWE